MPWIDPLFRGISSGAFVLFLVVNAAFVAGVWFTRDRHFVNRWTKPLVMTDAGLLVATIGAPFTGMAVKIAGVALRALIALPATMLHGK